MVNAPAFTWGTWFIDHTRTGWLIAPSSEPISERHGVLEHPDICDVEHAGDPGTLERRARVASSVERTRLLRVSHLRKRRLPSTLATLHCFREIARLDGLAILPAMHDDEARALAAKNFASFSRNLSESSSVVQVPEDRFYDVGILLGDDPSESDREEALEGANITNRNIFPETEAIIPCRPIVFHRDGRVRWQINQFFDRPGNRIDCLIGAYLFVARAGGVVRTELTPAQTAERWAATAAAV